jgi:flavodoxin
MISGGILMKSVVIYYSLEGGTKLVAEQIAKKTGSDIISVAPVKDIPAGGIGKYIVGGYRAISGSCPRLREELPSLGEYDTVIIGTPVWAGHCTPAIRTVLSTRAVYGKDVYLFACQAGSDPGRCFDDMKKLLAGDTVKATADFVNPKAAAPAELEKKADEFCSAMAQ